MRGKVEKISTRWGGEPRDRNVVLGLHVMPGELLNIAVNTGHVRRTHKSADGSLRQYAVELQLRTALASGGIELDGQLSALRLTAVRVEDHLLAGVADGRSLLVEWGIFLGEGRGEQLWRKLWSSNPQLGGDLRRPDSDVVLTCGHSGLVHHASLCGSLDLFVDDMTLAWRSCSNLRQE